MIPETGADSRTVDVNDCEEPGGLRETRVESKLSLEIGISPGGSFGDDLSTTVNGVAGTEGGEGEEVCRSVSSRRLPPRSVTFKATGVGGSTPMEGISFAVRSEDWRAPLRLTLNLENFFLGFGDERGETACSAV